MSEVNESAHEHFRKPLTTALMIALQVVRTSFGFHLRECMGSCSLSPDSEKIIGRRSRILQNNNAMK